MTKRLRKVSGVWRGFFHYDRIEGMSTPDPVAFTLTLRQGWFGRFTGSVREEGAGAMPGSGRIEGYYSFPNIEFRKWMPICYVRTDEGEALTFREWVIRNGHKCSHEPGHGPIRYSGDFTTDSKAEGIWIISAHFVMADDASFEMPGATGTWLAEKLS